MDTGQRARLIRQYRESLKAGSQVVWNRVKMFCLFTYCRQQSATFSSHFHTTWGPPFRDSLYLNSLTRLDTDSTEIYRARLKGGPQVWWFCYSSFLLLLPGFACSIHATWGPSFSHTYCFQNGRNCLKRYSRNIDDKLLCVPLEVRRRDRRRCVWCCDPWWLFLGPPAPGLLYPPGCYWFC